MLVCAVAGGGEECEQVCSCDRAVSIGGSKNIKVSDTAGMEGDGAKRLSLPATSVEEPHCFIRVRNADRWPGHDGLRFWVKSDTGSTWGVVALIYSDSWFRCYAGFPVSAKWTEVTIPWCEFTQRNYRGPIEQHLAEVQNIDFTVQPTIQNDNKPRPASVYDIDDIRVVKGLRPPATPLPSRVALARSAGKIASRKPLKILCLGTSITYGLKTSRATEAYPVLLESMLRRSLGRDNVTVVNFGLPGKSSWQAACNVQNFVVEQEPDLIVLEFLYNDVFEADADPARLPNYRDNMNRLLDMLLRYDRADIAVMLPSPYAATGKRDYLDKWVAQAQQAASERRLPTIDVYGAFKALPENDMIGLYYPNDTAHPVASGHVLMARTVHDTLLPMLKQAKGR